MCANFVGAANRAFEMAVPIGRYTWSELMQLDARPETQICFLDSSGVGHNGA